MAFILTILDKGFKLLVFDDNAPLQYLYRYGAPGLPTIDILLDNNVRPGNEIKWVWKNIEKSYSYKESDEYSARELIKNYCVFPDVGTKKRMGGFSFLSFVELI